MSYLENLVLNRYSFTYNEAITYLETIDIIELSRKINEIKNRILYQSKFTAFIYGNIEYSTLFESNNNINLNFPSIEKPRNTLRILHDINESHPNNKEKDNLVKYSFYIGQFEPIKIIYSIILNVGLSNIFYDDLRTKQQFGYIVESHLTEYQLKYYFVQLVQSTKSIEEIETAINNFNNTFLEKINEDEFNTFVETVIKTLNEKETKMTDYYLKYLKEIKNNTFTFNRKELLLKNIKNINFNNFKKFFKII